MIKLQIGCLIIMLFINLVYFSIKRVKSISHIIFSISLAISIIYLVFDIATVYTVNHLDTVSESVNHVCHIFYLGFLVTEVSLYLIYVLQLIEPNIKVCSWKMIIIYCCTIIYWILIIFMPLEYVITPRGNYSWGPAAYTAFLSITVNMCIAFIILIVNWKKIDVKKRNLIILAYAIQFGCMLFQMLNPTSLIACVGVTLVNLAYFLTVESPDMHLIEQLKLEKERADLANTAKSQFLSNMSHEIRTPMNGIVGMTDILLRSDLSDADRQYLVNIKHSGEALLNIINDILDFSKIESGKFEIKSDNYELLPMLNELKVLFETKIGNKNIEIIYDIDPNLPAVLYGDSLRIRQVITNLVNNAIKFTEKGSITLTARVEKYTNKSGDYLYVAVTDTGMGIKKEDFSKLFGAFSQVDTKKNRIQEGTGLGLSISKSFVELMGGKISVESTYHKGSTFSFVIPQRIIDATPALISKNENVENVKKTDLFIAPDAKILVVDDNIINLKVAKGLLEPLKMDVETASSGEEALKLLNNKSFDLVFMDHMMPVMDGVECTKIIRENEDSYYQKLPIIALSANAISGVKETFIEAGMDDFIPKPIDYNQICNVLLKYLPASLIKENSDLKQNDTDKSDEINIQGIDATKGIECCGSEKLFRELLGDFYHLIDLKSDKITKCLNDGLIKDYEIEVHAMKSAARMIGAQKLSEEFKMLEKSANINDIENIKQNTPGVIAHLKSYKSALEAFGKSNNEEKQSCTNYELEELLSGIKNAIEQFDLDSADIYFKQLEKYKVPECILNDMELLSAYISDVAMEEIMCKCDEMIGKISKK